MTPGLRRVLGWWAARFRRNTGHAGGRTRPHDEERDRPERRGGRFRGSAEPGAAGPRTHAREALPRAVCDRASGLEGRFTSRLHDEQVAAWLGVWLGVSFTVAFVTGLISHFMQHPPAWPVWPSRPVGLYRVTQGVHVIGGLATIPLLLAKLWTVYPKLWQRPPVRSLAHAASRAMVFLLVAGALFQLVTGLFNIAYFYPFPFFFTTAHYWTAYIVFGALVIHVTNEWAKVRGLRGPAPATMRPPYGRTGGRSPAPGESLAGLSRESDGLAPAAIPVCGPSPAGGPGPEQGDGAPTTAARHASPSTGLPSEPAASARTEPNGGDLTGPSRRGFFAMVAAACGLVGLTTVGETVTPLARLAVLAPRRPGVGSQRLPVNKSAAAAGVGTDPNWRLAVTGAVPRELSLSLADLRALPRHVVRLPIACVEGWSADATWAGVRLRDVLHAAGAEPGARVRVESLEKGGLYRTSHVDPPHWHDELTLLALDLNGEPLDPDHGHPCRLIAPDRPGVLQTKWIARLVVERP